MYNLEMIKLFLTDVDGCLTDGGMYLDENGVESKRFCVYDGMGMVLLRQHGIPCGILTSEKTPIVMHRARKLCLEYLYRGVGRKIDKAVCLRHVPALAEADEIECITKREAAEEICRGLGIGLENVCFVGDDVNDLDLLRAVGYPCCPSNALEVVKQVPGIHVLHHAGGEGAVREICDEIIDKIEKK